MFHSLVGLVSCYSVCRLLPTFVHRGFPYTPPVAVYPCHAWPWSYDHRPSHPYNAGTEHVGFSPTRQTLLATSLKRREVFGESHEGTASCGKPLVRRTCTWMPASRSQFIFPRDHFQGQQWGYCVTASWTPYHKHYTMRSFPL